MKIITLNLMIMLIALSMTVSHSRADSADLLYLESQNLLHESRFDAGKLELALAKINQALSIDADNVNYLSLLGSIHLLNGNHDNAMNSYLDALELDPGNPELFSQIADAHALMNNHDEALALYNKAIHLGANNWRTYQNRGYLLILQNKFAQALKDFNQAISLNSKALYAYNNRAVLHYEMEEYDSALADFKQVKKLDPDSPVPSLYQGHYLEMNGDIAGAAKQYKIAINRAENLPLYPGFHEAEIALDRVTTLLAAQLR